MPALSVSYSVPVAAADAARKKAARRQSLQADTRAIVIEDNAQYEVHPSLPSTLPSPEGTTLCAGFVVIF